MAGERWRLGRWLVIALGSAAAMLLALVAAVGRTHKYASEDWQIARQAGALIVHGDLTVYVDVPAAQMGPLALVASGLIHSLALYALIGCALLPAALASMVGSRPSRADLITAGAGGLLLAMPWGGDYAAEGHLDEILVLMGGVVMVRAYREDRAGWMVGAFAVAIAGKPTAVMLLPIAFLLSRRAGWTALIVGGLIWAPFALADLHGLLAAGAGIVAVRPGSLVDLLGLADPGDPYPIWVRPLMLVCAVLAAWLITARVGPEAALVAAVAVRAILEPGAFPMYSTALIAVALLVDLRRGGPPITAALAAASWFLAYLSWPLSPIEGVVRLSLIVAAVAVGLGDAGDAAQELEGSDAARSGAAIA